MSRIGKRVLSIPAGVNVNVENGVVTVKGPKGELTLDLVKNIEVKVEGKEWEEAMDKAFKKANKKAKIDGFRPGKAPKDIFLKKYGKEALYMDAADGAVKHYHDQTGLECDAVLESFKGDYALVDADSNASTCTGIVDVSGTFKTLTPNFGNILLHDGATFDLSENRSPVSLKSAASGKQTISFDNDALIYVKVGARSVFGGKPLISWDAIPENVTFQLTPEDAKRGALEVCDDGLYLKRGCAIFIR